MKKLQLFELIVIENVMLLLSLFDDKISYNVYDIYINKML